MDSQKLIKSEQEDFGDNFYAMKNESLSSRLFTPSQTIPKSGEAMKTFLEHGISRTGGNLNVRAPPQTTFKMPTENQRAYQALSNQPESSREEHQPRIRHEQEQQSASALSSNHSSLEKRLSKEATRAVLDVVQKYQGAVGLGSQSERIDALQHSLHQESDARARAENELRKIKEDRHEWDIRMSNLANGSLQREDEVKYQEQLSASQREIEKLQIALNDSQDQLARLQRTGASPQKSKVSDSILQGEWKQLQYNIRNLAYSLGRDPPPSELAGNVRTRLKQVNYWFRSHMKDKDTRVLLLEAYLWRFVIQQIFVASQGTWQHPTIRQFKCFRKDIFGLARKDTKKMEELAPWLATGWRMLNRKRSDPGLVQQAINIEARKLQPFMSSEERSNPREFRRMEDDLRKIFESALKLDHYFESSKAMFQLWSKYKEGPVFYDDKRMEVAASSKEPTDQTKIDFVVTPLLEKTGNADGHHYEASIILAKAQVVCP